MSTKKPLGYLEAVMWLAENDDHDPNTVEDVASLVTTALVADIYGRTPETVAQAVLKVRAALSSVPGIGA